MPILNPAKRAQLYSLGLDPDKYSDPNEIETPPEQRQPVAKPTAKTSAIGSAFRQFGRDFPATYAGLQAGIATTGLLQPEINPIIAPIGGIIAGLAASYAAKGLQNKAIGMTPIAKPYQESEETDIAEHPIATKIGGLASALPFLKPSLQPLREIGGMMAGDTIAMPAVKNALVNAGVQAGVGVGQEAYNQGTLTPKLNPTDVLLNAAAGALLNNPTKLGEKIGFEGVRAKPMVDANVANRLRVESSKPAEIIPEKPPINTIETQAADPTELLANRPDSEIGAARKIDAEIKKAKDGQALLNKITKANEKAQSKAEQAAAEYKAEDEHIGNYFGVAPEEFHGLKDETKALLRNTYKEEQAKAVGANEEALPKADNTLTTKLKAPKLNEQLNPSNDIELGAPKSIAVETPPIKPTVELPKLAENAKLSEDISTSLAKKKISPAHTKTWLDAFKNLISARNVKVDDTGKLFRNGKEISGEALMRNGLKEAVVNINPNKAKLDTLPHELLHPFMEDLETHGTNADKSLTEEGYDNVAKSQALKDWINSLPEDSGYRTLTPKEQAKEFLATNGGLDVVRRVLKTDNKGDFKNWLSDFWSNVKHKFGNAKPEDYARLLGRKLLKDRPFDEQAKLSNVKVMPNNETTEKHSEESQIERTKVPKDLMSFDRGGSRLDNYVDFLVNVKKLSLAEARSVIEELKSQTGRGEQTILDTSTPGSSRRSLSPERDRATNELKTQLNEQRLSEQSPLKEKKIAPVTYKGYQEGIGNVKGGPLYNLTDDIEGHAKGSSVTEDTLNTAGYSVPDEVKPKNSEESPLIEKTKVPAGMLSFSHEPSHLSGYYNWLKDVKKYSSMEAHRIISKLKDDTYNGARMTRNGLSYLENPDYVDDNSAQQESSALSEHSLLTEEDKKKASSSPVPPETLPTSNYNVRLPFFKPEMEKIYDKSPEAAEGLTKFYEEITRNRGIFNNKFSNDVRSLADLDSVIKSIFTHPKDYIRQDTKELQNVRDWFWAKQDGKELPTLSANEESIKSSIQNTLKEVREQHMSRKGLRKAMGFDENYFPNTIDTRIIRELNQNPESPKSKQLREDFIKYQMAKDSKISLEEATKRFEKIMSGYNNKEVNIAEKFGPIDDAAGFGVPESWRDHNLLDLMNRYLDRVSRRFAYHDAIESNPKVVEALAKFKGNDSVKTVLNDVAGNKYYDDPLLNNLGGLVRSTIMGPLTGVRDFTSNITLGFQHQGPIQAIKNIVKAWGTMKENIADGFESGRLRTHMNSLEIDNGLDDFVHVLKRGRDILADLSGRNWFDQMARATSFGQGRFTTLDFLEQQSNGNLSKMGRKWFQDFGKETNWESGTLTPEEVKRIAGRYVDSVQGTYDYRGLPKIAVEGSWSPILQLARWNIEKSNNFMKYSVNPLLNGNPTPFLMSTLGMIAGGELVNYATELITKRKRKEATYTEIGEAENKTMPLFYKMAGLASAAGHVGMVGDLVKSVLDITYGKNRPQVYNNILLEAAENSATTLGNMVSAIHEDGYSQEVITGAVNQILEDNFQAYRLALAYVSADKKEDIDRANKLRDLRVFNTINGNGITDLTSPFHVSLEDLKLKQFKRTDDIGEAMELLPELIRGAIDKSNGDSEKLKKELSKIKRNSYQTVPNPELIPNSFLKYINFLERTQGADEAKNRLLDYIKHNEVNKTKVSGL